MPEGMESRLEEINKLAFALQVIMEAAVEDGGMSSKQCKTVLELIYPIIKTSRARA